LLFLLFYFFFFQAEDGIRDGHVTGVQTCALPILAKKPSAEETPERFREFFGEEFYERFFRRRPRDDARASGSGVIVDPKGYILRSEERRVGKEWSSQMSADR